MKRNSLLQLLHNYHPTAPEEVVFKQQMIEFIHEHADCFERSLAIGHITASAWIVSKNGAKALLMHHTKLDKWFQLGGHCDGNPDVLEVAVKEAQEESGIMGIAPVASEIFDIDIHLIPANSRGEKAHYHYDVRFLLRVTSGEEIVQNRESKELRWITKDPASLPTRQPSILRMFNKWLQAPTP